MGATPQPNQRIRVKDEALRARAPRGRLAYVEKPAGNQTITGSGQTISSLSAVAVIPAGRIIKVSTQGVLVNQSGVAAWSVWNINQNALTIRNGVGSHAASGNAVYYTHEVWHVFSPVAGTYTYTVMIDISNANMLLETTGTRIVSILVEDIGAA